MGNGLRRGCAPSHNEIFRICSMKIFILRCCLLFSAYSEFMTAFGTNALCRSAIYPGFWSTGCWLSTVGITKTRSQPVTATRSGERRKLPKWGLGRSPSRQRSMVPFRLKWKHLVLFKFVLFKIFTIFYLFSDCSKL